MSRQEYKARDFWITHTIEEDGPHETIPHDHYDDSFCITFILEGGGTCYVEGIAYPLSNGTIMVISPEEIRWFQLEQSGYHERITLYFSGSIVTSLWGYELPLIQRFIANPSEFGNWFTPEHYNPAVVDPILEELRALLVSDKDMKGPRLHLLILQLLFALYDARRPSSKNLVLNETDTVILEMCKYIKTHLGGDLSYEFFREQFFVSRYQLTEKFKQQTGMTLTKYVNTKRLMQVIANVRSGMRLEAAAYVAGFHTYCHFYKEFVKHFGTSPKAYFKANQKEGG